MLSRALTPIGVDIGRHSMKAAQARKRRGGWEVVAAASVPRRDPGKGDALSAEDATRLAGVLDRQGFHGTGIVLAAPRGTAVSQTVTLPPRSSGAPLEQIVRAELARAMKIEPGALEAEWWESPGPVKAETTSALAVACAHAAIERFVNPLHQAGLHVRAVDASCWCLVRALLAPDTPEASLIALVDLGAGGVGVTIASGRTVAYERQIADAGWAALQARLCAELSLSPETAARSMPELSLIEATDTVRRRPGGRAEASAVLASHIEALGEELALSMSYALGRMPDRTLSRVILCGEPAKTPGLAAHLGAAMGLEAAVASPHETPTSHASNWDMPALAIALGAALCPPGVLA